MIPLPMILVSALLACLSPALAGDMDDAILAGKGYAKGRNAEIRTMHNDLDGNETEVPNYAGTAIPQSDYYTNGTNLENEARAVGPTDRNSRYIHHADSTRRSYSINRTTDPLLAHKPALETQATGLATTWTGCRDIAVAGGSTQICGSQFICPDGTCTADVGRTMPTSVDGFRRAATSLAIIQEMKDTFDPARLEVFRGQHKKCKRPRPVASWDCCHDSSSSYCNAEDIELFIDNDLKRTHYVGTHNECQARVPLVGTCIWWHNYKDYCSFPSKLARIIVVQGRGQINKPYGRARNPDCSGFSLTELATVDLESMDLSEFVADVDARGAAQTTPAAADAADDLKAKLTDPRYGRIN